MRKVYIIVISTVALILIICGIEFFTNNRHEENIITNANQNVVINQNLINNSLNNTTNQGVVNKKSVDNVTMIIKDGTLTKTSATVIIEDKNEEKYNYSSWFRIDKKENEGWKEVNVIDEKYAFTDIAYLPDENGKVEMNTNWKNLYGELEKGEYRLVKEVYDNGNNYIYVEFTIE